MTATFVPVKAALATLNLNGIAARKLTAKEVATSGRCQTARYLVNGELVNLGRVRALAQEVAGRSLKVTTAAAPVATDNLSRPIDQVAEVIRRNAPHIHITRNGQRTFRGVAFNVYNTSTNKLIGAKTIQELRSLIARKGWA